jgi:hypothetical protein
MISAAGVRLVYIVWGKFTQLLFCFKLHLRLTGLLRTVVMVLPRLLGPFSTSVYILFSDRQLILNTAFMLVTAMYTVGRNPRDLKSVSFIGLEAYSI